jgi:hypothetical protein
LTHELPANGGDVGLDAEPGDGLVAETDRDGPARKGFNELALVPGAQAVGGDGREAGAGFGVETH